ncbi:hypothetical protein HGM15179_019851 [Zosterops borbonicus]|uniref:Uncharacterized protein n=1 Tax=Zosterops borbonicus TaxID=364589 RepID=A0A8K1FXY9_9PASS|nr:hypothetical protein HGM15179_019851 [Zosterops borbonicus]
MVTSQSEFPTSFHSSQWEGPFQVLLNSFTAVKIKEQASWIHHTSIKKAPQSSWKVTQVHPGKVSLTGKEWQKHPIGTSPEVPCILSIDFLRNGYYKGLKGLKWAFGIATVEAEGIRQLNTLPGLSVNLSTVGVRKVEEQQVAIATLAVNDW